MKNAILACFGLLVVGLLDTCLATGFRRQKRSWVIEKYYLYEGNPGPFPMLVGKIPSENDPDRTMSIRGPGATEDPVGLLYVNNDEDTLYITGPLDYEKHQTLNLVFESEKDGEKIDTRLAIVIFVLDINDNPPLFSKEVYTATLNESQGHVDKRVPVAKVYATDADKPGTENSTFTFRIVLVSPASENVQFFIETKGRFNNKKEGIITFQGCLNYQVESSYTIIVEAKDQGKAVKLSSTSKVIVNVRDQNNHPPTIAAPFVPKKVKENEHGMEVGRILVTDEDIQGTPSWKARFTIHGDPGGYLKISTDLKTNEGVVTIEKPLDYEEMYMMNLSITVENEEPLFCCKPSKEQCSSVASKLQLPFVFEVENENEPPVFDPPLKIRSVLENIAVGTYLEQLTAKDPDNKAIKYRKGKDPAGWVSVDTKTGDITTAKHLDRESPYVKNNRYNVTIYAEDEDDAPMTGTATLIIHLIDINDNAPTLKQTHFEMCVSHGPVRALISATDKDEKHHSVPYLFEVLKNDHGHWRFEPASGKASNLTTDNGNFADRHVLTIKVADSQGRYSVSNVTITISNCEPRTAPTQHLNGGAIAVILASLLLLFCILALVANCNDVKQFIQLPALSEGHLLKYHTEGKGEDTEPLQEPAPEGLDKVDGIVVCPPATCLLVQDNKRPPSCIRNEDEYYQALHVANSVTLIRLLQKVSSEEASEEYEPREYADEGPESDGYHLDPIPIPEEDDSSAVLGWDMGSKFKPLAAMCRPDLFQTQSQLAHIQTARAAQHHSQLVQSQYTDISQYHCQVKNSA